MAVISEITNVLSSVKVAFLSNDLSDISMQNISYSHWARSGRILQYFRVHCYAFTCIEWHKITQRKMAENIMIRVITKAAGAKSISEQIPCILLQ